MKRLVCTVAMVCLALGVATVRTSYSEEAEKQLQKAEANKAKAEAPAKPEAAESKRKKAQGRLPNYYGQVGLSDDQKKQVYAVQEEYRRRIEELERQLKEVRDQETDAINAVLTPEQIQKLNEFVLAAKKKAEERKAAPKKEGEPKKDAATEKTPEKTK